MRRFTVSLPDELYEALRRRGDEATPPASLQQMVRFAVDTMLEGGSIQTVAPETPTTDSAGATLHKAVQPVDLLVFSVLGVHYGIPIEVVETVAARLRIHQVPSSSGSMVGVARFREGLTEVHDGGIVLQDTPLNGDEAPSLLAIPAASGRMLITVSSVIGLTPAGANRWADPPISSPGWVMALAWNATDVIAVVDPAGFQLS